MSNLEFPLVCLVTNRQKCLGRKIEEIVAAAVDGGVDMVQLRERGLSSARLYDLAYKIRKITRDKALFLVNDRIDIALAVGADGIQLPENGLGMDVARELVGSRAIVSRSVHSVDGAIIAEKEGADLVVLGTVFGSESHHDVVPGGLDLLRRTSGQIQVPILAIGGVTDKNIELVVESGAIGCAVISTITKSEDPFQASRKLVVATRTAWSHLRLEGKHDKSDS